MTLVSARPHPHTCHNLIGGNWHPSSGGLRELLSPHDGSLIGHVPMSTAAEAQEAVRAAAQAFPAWRALTLKERTVPLSKASRWLNLRSAYKIWTPAGPWK